MQIFQRSKERENRDTLNDIYRDKVIIINL